MYKSQLYHPQVFFFFFFSSFFLFSACTFCYSLIRHLIEFPLSDCTHTPQFDCVVQKTKTPTSCNILRFICPVINHLLMVMIIAVPQTKDCVLRSVWNESSGVERSKKKKSKQIGSNDRSDTAQAHGPDGNSTPNTSDQS